MDFSQLSTADLQALQTGDLTKVSNEGLQALKQGQLADAQAADRAKYSPTNGTLDNVLSGIGAGMTRVGRAVGQAVGSGIDAVAPTTMNSLITGQTPSARLGLPQQSDVESARKLEAPLMETTSGKIGNVIGQAATVAPAMFIPGANTLVGSAVIGAGLGAATTEGDVRDRILGAAGGGAGGIAGNVIGKGLGAGANWLIQRRAAQIAADAAAAGGKPAAAQAAMSAGYVLPPTEINPSLLNSALEGFSGKIKTSQSASQSNQPVTNKLAQVGLGLPQDRPITIDALKSLRATEGQNYSALGSTGTVSPGPAYDSALDAIVAPYTQAARSFPEAQPNPLIAQINGLRTPQFDAADALSKISTLRDAADTAYGSQNKLMGKSLKSAANALEDALDEHVSGLQSGAQAFEAQGVPPGTLPDYGSMLENFRNARTNIAKSYSVQSALNNATGDVSAPKLAAQLAKGRPLSDELLTIAQAGQAFPKATQALSQDYNALSPLDYAAAVIAGAHNPLAAAGIGLRPMVRAGILSRPYQNFAVPGAPSETNALLRLLSSQGGQGAAQLGGMSAGPDFLQMPTTVIRGSPANQ